MDSDRAPCDSSVGPHTDDPSLTNEETGSDWVAPAWDHTASTWRASSSIQLSATEKPVLFRARCCFPGTMPLPGQEARGPPRAARNCIQVSYPCLPVGTGSGTGALCLACSSGSQGSHTLPASWAQGAGRLGSQVLQGQSVAQRHFLQETEPPGSPHPPPNPAPSPLSSKVTAVPGLCQHAARLRCAGPGAVAWNGHLLCLNPHSQRVRDPLELGGRRARTRERPRFAVYPAEWQGSPGKPG